MSYVDLMSNQRWTLEDLRARNAALIRSELNIEREFNLFRRFLGSMLPTNHPLYRPMSPQHQAEIAASVLRFDAIEAEGTAAEADAALLNATLDIEELKQKWDSIPSAPEEGEDPYVDQRNEAEAAYQTAYDNSTQAVKDLLAAREAARTPPEEPSETGPV